jgi:hypothetical protein
MKGTGFKVMCIEEMEVWKEIPNIPDHLETVIFIEGVIYTALSSVGKLAIIDRNHKNVVVNNEIFNKHFKLI